MNYISCFLFGCFCLLIACTRPRKGRQALEKSHTYTLGNTSIIISQTAYHPAGRHFFIQLHHNESTAAEVALAAAEKHGGTVVSLQNTEERLVDFIAGDARYRFDPNRIFTEQGRKKTLQLFRTYDTVASAHLETFASFLLRLVPQTGHVLSLHNNTDQEYTVYDYQNKLSGDARLLYINPAMDPDDFVYTTDSALFRFLQEKNINAVLQDNSRVADDGSLSVWLGRKGRSYTNVEAEFGHRDEQRQMLLAVMEFAEKRGGRR